tara:strand:+ start:3861 stop:4787 length:927 start_codon:yes stop_codon:yes gene_type:complete
MAKYSDDSKELGASRVGAIVLGENKFTTNERERLKTINAINGVTTLGESDFNKEAKDRGNYLEKGLMEWAKDKLEHMSEGKAIVKLAKVTHGYRLDDLKLCASLDGILQIDGEVLVRDPVTRGHMALSGFGALEIKTMNAEETPRMDQVIQLQTQLMCSGFKWGIIAIFGKLQKLHLFPYKADKNLFEIITDKVHEFWNRVENDVPYPPIDNGKPVTINLDHLKMKNEVLQLITDYNKAKSETLYWQKNVDECKEALELVMSEHDAEYAEIGGFKINNPLVKRKAVPERIVPAKDATYHRRFSIEEIK